MLKNLPARLNLVFGSLLFFCIQRCLWLVASPRFIVLIGPAGIGKGTLATELVEALSLRQLSTGDAFRREKASNSELGRLIADTINCGALVEDDITMSVVERELMRARYWRGGEPRRWARSMCRLRCRSICG